MQKKKKIQDLRDIEIIFSRQSLFISFGNLKKKWEGRKEKDEKKDNWMTKQKCQEVKTPNCFNFKNPKKQTIRSEDHNFSYKTNRISKLEKDFRESAKSLFHMAGDTAIN